MFDTQCCFIVVRFFFCHPGKKKRGREKKKEKPDCARTCSGDPSKVDDVEHCQVRDTFLSFLNSRVTGRLSSLPCSALRRERREKRERFGLRPAADGLSKTRLVPVANRFLLSESR